MLHRNQFEDDPDGKDTIKRDRANTHKSEANENENSDKSKRDRTSPYRIEINESSTSNLSSPRSPKSTGTTADSLSEESSVNGDPLTFEYPRQRAEYPLGKESTGYPSRSSYELRGTDSRDSRDEELRVSDFDWVRLQLHCAIYRPDSFVVMLRQCVNLKAIRCESTSLNRIAADKSHCVIVT